MHKSGVHPFKAPRALSTASSKASSSVSQALESAVWNTRAPPLLEGWLPLVLLLLLLLTLCWGLPALVGGGSGLGWSVLILYTLRCVCVPEGMDCTSR